MGNESKIIITVLLKKVKHRNKVRLLLVFAYDDLIISKIRKIDGYFWSKTLRGWYTDFTKENVLFIKELLKNDAVFKLDNSVYNHQLKDVIERRERTVSDENMVILNSYSSYLAGKCYSESTVKTYSSFIADFFNYLKERSLIDVCNRDVEKFIEDVFIPKKYSISTHRQFVSAIKLLKVFYPECKIVELELQRPKKSMILPTVLSKEEVIDLLRYTKNLKHRAVLSPPDADVMSAIVGIKYMLLILFTDAYP